MEEDLNPKEEIHKAFIVIRSILDTIFFYPPKMKSYKESPTLRLKAMWAVRWLHMINFILCSTQQWIFLFTKTNTLTEIVDSLATCIPDSVTIYIMLNMYFERAKFVNILNNMNEYAEDGDKMTGKILRKKGKQLIVISWVFYVVVGLTMTCYVTIPFYIGYQEGRKGGNWRMVPFNSYYPFERNESPQYYFIVVLEMLRAAILLQAVVGNDCIYAGSIMIVVAFFNVMSKSLEDMGQVARENVEEACGKQRLTVAKKQMLYEKEMVRLMKRFIKQHQQLLNICELVKEAFGGFIFMHLLLHAAALCVVGNQLLILLRENDIPNAIKYILYLQVLILELTMYGYFGSELIDASERVNVSIFHSEWYTVKEKDVKDLAIFMMTRAQKPCVVTALGFAVMSLETVVAVLSSAGSYFTLLQSFRDEDADG